MSILAKYNAAMKIQKR